MVPTLVAVKQQHSINNVLLFKVGISSFNNLNPEGIFFAVSNPESAKNAIHIWPLVVMSSWNFILGNILVVSTEADVIRYPTNQIADLLIKN